MGHGSVSNRPRIKKGYADMVQNTVNSIFGASKADMQAHTKQQANLSWLSERTDNRDYGGRWGCPDYASCGSQATRV